MSDSEGRRCDHDVGSAGVSDSEGGRCDHDVGSAGVTTMWGAQVSVVQRVGGVTMMYTMRALYLSSDKQEVPRYQCSAIAGFNQ